MITLEDFFQSNARKKFGKAPKRTAYFMIPHGTKILGFLRKNWMKVYLVCKDETASHIFFS